MTEGPETRWSWNQNRHRTYAASGWVSDTQMLDALVAETRGLARGATMIDLGCGLGHLVAAFHPLAAKCVGVDIDSNMLSQAPKLERAEYVNCPIQEFRHDPVEVVASRNVFHYVGPDVLFSKADELLKPGGIFVLCQAVPPSSRTRSWHEELHTMLGVGPAPSSDDLVAAFRDHGFRAIRGSFHFHRMNVTRWVDARVEAPELRERVIRHHKELGPYPEYEADLEGNELGVTVRFAIVSGVRASR